LEEVAGGTSVKNTRIRHESRSPHTPWATQSKQRGKNKKKNKRKKKETGAKKGRISAAATPEAGAFTTSNERCNVEYSQVVELKQRTGEKRDENGTKAKRISRGREERENSRKQANRQKT